MAKIKITLYSDLCPASGAGFGSVIDTDVCYDSKGFPYIPSRRLKGCLREAAQDIGCPAIDGIFGKSGDSSGGSLRFSSDARIDNLSEELSALSPEEVLDKFTYTRAGTEIKDGTVKPESLRFIRVVKQYSPVDQEPLKFVAECEIDSPYDKEMIRICKALRNIGYKRNRGFGAVRCCFDSASDKKTAYFPDLENDMNYSLPIAITNTVPLVLSSQNDDETETYISGGQVLGALAWAYLKTEGKAASDEDFAKIFLDGKVRFSNCVPGAMPAPLCYAKMKKSRDYRNLAQKPMRPDESDQAKLLKGKYLVPYVDGYWQEMETRQEVIYHHRTQKDGQDALLYMQTALCAGQSFNGIISGKGRYLKQLQPLLVSGTLRIGKSKTAQYAVCDVKVGEPLPPPQTVAINQKIAVILLSDVLLLQDGIYTVDNKALAAAIQPGANINEEASSLAYRVVTGYSGVWNLKKPHARAFKAGSVLVLDSPDKVLPEEFIIGERQHEGFGRCMAMPLGKMPKIKAPDYASKPGTKDGIYTSYLRKQDLEERVKAQAIAYARENKLEDAITSSQIGRVLLMLEQSSTWADFQKRLASIKAKFVRESLLAYIQEESSDYKTYWSIVLRWKKYQRKIEAAAKGGDAQ